MDCPLLDLSGVNRIQIHGRYRVIGKASASINALPRCRGRQVKPANPSGQRSADTRFGSTRPGHGRNRDPRPSLGCGRTTRTCTAVREAPTSDRLLRPANVGSTSARNPSAVPTESNLSALRWVSSLGNTATTVVLPNERMTGCVELGPRGTAANGLRRRVAARQEKSFLAAGRLEYAASAWTFQTRRICLGACKSWRDRTTSSCV